MKVNVSPINDLYRLVNQMTGELATKRDGSLWDKGGFVSMSDALYFATAINTKKLIDSTIPKGKDGKDGARGEKGKDGKSAEGFVWRGNYDPAKYYSKGDVVRWDGSAFIWVENRVGQGVQPSTEKPWDLFVQRGDHGRPGGSGGGASINFARLIPLGGVSGQVLAKSSDENYDTEWINVEAATSGDGKSAYEIAVENGFSGTEEEWLQSLHGSNGADGENGLSAFEIAQNAGFSGTESEWLESLNGADGADGINGADGASSMTELSDVSLTGIENGDLLFYNDGSFEPIAQNQLATSGGISSDLRKKYDIKKSKYSTEEILKLNPIIFSYNEDPENEHVGLIAQEVQKIIPEAVKLGKDNFYLIEYHAIIGVLINSIKELNNRIKILENK